MAVNQKSALTGKQKLFLTHWRRAGGTIEEMDEFLSTHDPIPSMLQSLEKYYKIKTPGRKKLQLISLFSSGAVKKYLEKQETRGKVKKVDGISVEERKKRQKLLLECEIPEQKPERKKGGPKTRYSKTLDAVVQKLFGMGATYKEVHSALGVHVSTFYEWRHAHQSFDDAIVIGRDEWMTHQAEDALERKMLGYTKKVTETEIEVTKGGEKKVKSIKVKEKIFPEDTRALTYYLNNRNKRRWSDRPEEKPATSPAVDADRQRHIDSVAGSDAARLAAEEALDSLIE